MNFQNSEQTCPELKFHWGCFCTFRQEGSAVSRFFGGVDRVFMRAAMEGVGKPDARS
jgi:hypothetical protein